MFIRSRWTVALAAVLSSLICTGTFADSISTALAYESAPNKLQGASVTYVDPTPSFACAMENFLEVGWQADQWDGTPDGFMWLCVQFHKYVFKAGVQGFTTNPATSIRSFYGSSMSYYSSYAGIAYLISSPASGTWLADADHFYGYESEYCPAHYNPYPYFNPWDPIIDVEWCTSGPSDYGLYLDSTSDEAEVP